MKMFEVRALCRGIGDLSDPPRQCWLFAWMALHVVFIAACSGDANIEEISAVRGHDCQLPRDRHVSGGISVIKTTQFPCVLHIEETGIRLSPDLENKWPDPDVPLVLAEDGGFFSISASSDPAVLKWSPEGRLKKSFGRRGKGPGEFDSFYVQPFPGPDGLLYVRGSGKWLFLDQELNLIREIRSGVPGDLSSTVVLADGRILSSDPRAGPKNKRFHILNHEDGTVESIGDSISALEDSLRIAGVVRSIAYAGGDEFWVAPLRGAGSGYTLERWSVSGERTQVLTREVSWYPVGSDVASAVAPTAGTEISTQEEGARPRRPVVRPPSFIRSIFVDDSGLLYVYVDVVSDRWRDIANPAERALAYAQMIDSYVEVIDPAAGVVLASTGPRSIPPSSIPEHFPLSRLGYTSEADSSGLYEIKLLRFRLTTKR